MMRRTLLVIVALGLAGCQDPAVTRGIEATRVSKLVTTIGTSTVMGTFRLPSDIVSNNSGSLISNNAGSYRTAALGPGIGLPRVAVRLVDAKGQPIPDVATVLTDGSGAYEVPEAPVGRAMIVEGEIQTTSGPIKLRKYLRPSEALSCANVDLATTMVLDKLLSGNPLVGSDPGLAGSDLFELVDPAKLQEVEAAVRSVLSSDEAPTASETLAALVEGGTSALFDQVAEKQPELGHTYDETFERPDSSLGLRISAVGENRAIIPKSDGPVVMGVMEFKVAGAPFDARTIEYRIAGKLVAQGPAPLGPATLDTWTVPNGPCTLEAMAVMPDGRRVVLSRTYMVIRNSLDMHCPS